MDDELSQLQSALARVDLFSPLSPRPYSDPNRIELLLARLQQIKLKMYQEQGHPLPHLHIDYGRSHHCASFQIDPPSLIAGNLNRAHINAILEWITPRRELLKKTWGDLQSGRPVSEHIFELNAAE